ncbi:MAG: hypothetical protein JWO44_1774 [Bacteroidetes bacterium]|nr:hypothetical protein [Bacteroidota bacterium]
MKAVSIVLIVMGILLFWVGFLFKVMHWPDLFKGMYSGPVLIVAGIIILIIRKARPKAS